MNVNSELISLGGVDILNPSVFGKNHFVTVHKKGIVKTHHLVLFLALAILITLVLVFLFYEKNTENQPDK